jgi:hypothetical protein
LRIKSALLPAALASAALLAACSGNGSGTQSALPGSSMQSQSHVLSMAARSGIAPQFLSILHAATPARHKKRHGLKELVVSDAGLGELVEFNNKYVETGDIVDSGPDGDWVDRKEQSYAANYASIDVTEYSKTGSLLSTYSASLTDPVDVATDHAGNVYVANYGSSGAAVVEYPQGSNTPNNTCNTGLNNDGIALDNKGDVFVSGNNPNTGSGILLEYKGGLSGCSATTLGATVSFAGGLQVDNKGELIACDQLVGVDIIPAPYNSISKTITVAGGSDYFHDALDQKNKTLFIADAGTGEVYVVSFQAGSLLKTLNSSNGLSLPYGVATYPYQL